MREVDLPAEYPTESFTDFVDLDNDDNYERLFNEGGTRIMDIEERIRQIEAKIFGLHMDISGYKENMWELNEEMEGLEEELDELRREGGSSMCSDDGYEVLFEEE